MERTAAAPGDLDGDGDIRRGARQHVQRLGPEGVASAVYLENDGRQNFTTRELDRHPTHLVTADCAIWMAMVASTSSPDRCA